MTSTRALGALALGALLAIAGTVPASALAADDVPAAEEVRFEAEDALIPPGSNALVKHESGMSNGAYVELAHETGEQRGSVLVFRDALRVDEPGVYRIDIGYKTAAGDYKKQLIKVIEPLDDYVVEDKNLVGEKVVLQVAGEFQSSGWVEKDFLLKLDRTGVFDLEIQGDWGYQHIDYLDVHRERVAVDATIGVSTFAFYRDSPEDLEFGYEPNYNGFVRLEDDRGEVDPSLYEVDAEAKRIAISREYFAGAPAEGAVRVVFDGGAAPSFAYTVADAVPVRSLLEAEDGTLLGGSAIRHDEATGVTYLAIEREGGVQWIVDAPEDGRYRLGIRYRATTGDKVQDVVVRNAQGELRYGTGFPITPFEIPRADSRDGWETVTQDVELIAGRNTLEIARNWGWTDIDYVRIGDDEHRPLPAHVTPEISPTADSYARNDPRELRIHLQRNANDLLSVVGPDGQPFAFEVVDFDTSDLDSGYRANMREIVLPNDALAALPLGQNELTLVFSDGTRLAYTVDVSPFVQRGELQIVSFEVGHGNATLMRLPNGKNLLIDSGKPEAADAVVLPYLRSHGIQLDYYLVTHFHDDHTGRLDQIVEEAGLDRISKTEAFDLVAQGTPARLKVLRDLEYLDNTMLLPGDELHEIWDLGGVEFTILNSRYDENGEEVADLDENNVSIAAMIEYRGFRYLHQADIYAKTNDVLLERFGDDPAYWDVDYLLANHHFHGSVSPRFLRLTNPDLVFVPVSGALYARGAYTTLYRDFVESYLKQHDGDLGDTIVSAASGSVVIDVDGHGGWRRATYKQIALPDVAAPALAGVADVTLPVADAAAFDARAGVLAMDNVDGDVTAQVAVSGRVDTAAGTYVLEYAVTDRAGNQATQQRNVVVLPATGDDGSGDGGSGSGGESGSDSDGTAGGSRSAGAADGLASTGGTAPWLAGALGVLAALAGLLMFGRARRADGIRSR